MPVFVCLAEDRAPPCATQPPATACPRPRQARPTQQPYPSLPKKRALVPNSASGARGKPPSRGRTTLSPGSMRIRGNQGVHSIYIVCAPLSLSSPRPGVLVFRLFVWPPNWAFTYIQGIHCGKIDAVVVVVAAVRCCFPLFTLKTLSTKLQSRTTSVLIRPTNTHGKNIYVR